VQDRWSGVVASRRPSRSKARPIAMPLQVDQMSRRKAGQLGCGLGEEQGALGCAEEWMEEDGAVVGEADLAGVEGGVPQG